MSIFLQVAVSFGLSVILGRWAIPFFKHMEWGQAIREEGPKRHYEKTGTPTMGGMIFLAASVVTVGVTGMATGVDRIEEDLLFLLFVTLGFGLVGFLDDFVKVAMKRNLGLTNKQKLLMQFFMGSVFLFLFLNHPIHGFEIQFSTTLESLYFWLLLLTLVIVSNAVNYTDGLDGLVAGTSVIVYGVYIWIGIQQDNPVVVLFAASMVGAISAFLLFNWHPAKIFMGDTGSLALGGGVAAVAVVTDTVKLLPVFAAIFLLEMLSVMVQVFSFKVWGKRIFRMSPVHHHFELLGWSERKIVTVFWFCQLLFSGIGVGLYLS
ncbi:phospho-N-acetylmuramoyl-pentapeptide-transferase [Salinithrix halophila]|uniref:Phospho-N-acetylmuramoyl-pentapeptide-transferase n=1 Tax=Salinithrix halophila TaxID=1485204 RepID=A0ABV8JIR7_9BACL